MRFIRDIFNKLFTQTILAKRAGYTLCILFLAILLPAGNSQMVKAADGDLDPTFGTGGKVVTDFFGDSDYAQAIAVQPDGKIVAAGEAENYAALARYNPDGSLDLTFGNGGLVVSNSIFTSLTGIRIQPDGKILAAGNVGSTNYDFFLTRYNPDGTLDTTFGDGGQVITFFGVDSSDLRSVVLLPDGKIFATGVVINGLNTGIAMAQYESNGSLDQNFGSGKFVTYYGGNRIGGYSAAVQADGKVVVAGYLNNEFALVRYNTNGSLDTTFGSGGFSGISVGSGDAAAKSVDVQPDGKIAAAGYVRGGNRNHDFVLIRCNTNGSLDTTFGSGGRVQTDFSNGSDDLAESLIIQSNGKFIAAGHSGAYPNFTFGVARYSSDGQLDQTFGNSGKATTAFTGSVSQQGYAASLQPNGKIVLAGFLSNAGSGTFDFALARYLSSRRTQFDFDGDGRADISVYRSGVWYLNRSSAGVLGFQFGLSGDNIVPADYDGDGKTDIAVFRPGDGNWYCYNSGNSTYSISNFGVNGDVPVAADYDGDGRADYAVFRQGTWYLQRSTAGLLITQFGLSTDKPVPADYDGDDKTDIAVFRDGTWYINRSAQGLTVLQLGTTGERPVPADYDGDGKSDAAVWRPSGGLWSLIQSSNGTTRTIAWGANGDIPAAGDYDGDGKADPAIYRGGEWWIWQSQTNNYTVQQFGITGDVPVPSAYVQ